MMACCWAWWRSAAAAPSRRAAASLFCQAAASSSSWAVSTARRWAVARCARRPAASAWTPRARTTVSRASPEGKAVIRRTAATTSLLRPSTRPLWTTTPRSSSSGPTGAMMASSLACPCQIAPASGLLGGDRPHVGRLGAFLALGDVELDGLAVLQRGAVLDAAGMDEDVVAGLGRDEAVAAVGVEPLDGSNSHEVVPPSVVSEVSVTPTPVALAAEGQARP